MDFVKENDQYCFSKPQKFLGAFGADTLSPSYSYQLIPLYPNLDREHPPSFQNGKQLGGVFSG